jgi:hypothetical protein
MITITCLILWIPVSGFPFLRTRQELSTEAVPTSVRTRSKACGRRITDSTVALAGSFDYD